MKVSKWPPCWCGASCIDGTCPIAMHEQYQSVYEDMGYDIIHSCKECGEVVSCETCVFEGSEMCDKEVCNERKNHS